MSTIKLVIESANRFYDVLKKDGNGRYRSWEHCYKCFHDARDKKQLSESDLDYFSLQLAFYLASWGMYRGSSFLLQKDYKIHKKIVEMILEPQYNCLLAVEYLDLKKTDVQEKIKDLDKRMREYYSGIRETVYDNVKIDVSDTLITKILMGTLGCVPAYDRYFIDGIKSCKVTTGNFNIKSLLKLVDFYEKHVDQLEDKRKKFKVYDLEYPQMKLLDMGFWQIGYERDEN